MGILEFLEQTPVSTFIRESESLLAFPGVLCLHPLGLSLVVGANSIVAIRLLGVAPGIPLQPLKKLFPFMWAGLILSALSGFALVAAKATSLTLNPLLDFKLFFVLVATITMKLMQKRVFSPQALENAKPGDGKMMAVVLLACWVIVMTSGRLIAYSMSIFY